MKNESVRQIILFIVVGTIVIAGVFYDILPDLMSVHWDINGNINYRAPKIIALLAIPTILLLVTFYIGIWTKPIKEFQPVNMKVALVVAIFSMSLQILVVGFNTSFIDINIVKTSFGVFSIFLFLCANYAQKLYKNKKMKVGFMCNEVKTIKGIKTVSRLLFVTSFIVFIWILFV